MSLSLPACCSLSFPLSPEYNPQDSSLTVENILEINRLQFMFNITHISTYLLPTLTAKLRFSFFLRNAHRRVTVYFQYVIIGQWLRRSGCYAKSSRPLLRGLKGGMTELATYIYIHIHTDIYTQTGACRYTSRY